jgi:uncharacterized protein (TIGR03083 family)
MRGRLTVAAATALIEADAAALRAAAEGHFDAAVPHTDWTMADLVWHIGRVHWMWKTVVSTPITTEQELHDHPDIDRVPDDRLLDFAAEQAAGLVAALRTADPAARCYTWFPGQQDVGFVIRHQVQEAAVHRWDAQHALGSPAPIDATAAADAVEEFLEVSVANPTWPAEDAAPLGAPLVLAATDTGDAWTITDGEPGIVHATHGAADGSATVRGTASELLLWLYERADLPAQGPDAAGLVDRFRAYAYTD